MKKTVHDTEEAKSRFSALADIHPELIVIHDLNGTIRYINRVTEGYCKEDVIGTSIFSYIPEEHHREIKRLMKSLVKKPEPIITEYPTFTSDAMKIWWHVRIIPLACDGKVREFLVERTNVTEKLEDEFHQQDNITRYRTLFENISNGVAILQVFKNGTDFIFVDFNRAAESIEQIPRDKIIGRTLLDMFPAAEQCGLIEIFKRVWETGHPEHYPSYLYTDGRISGWRKGYVYKLPSDELVHVYSDETERIKSEHTLQLTEFSVRHAAIPTYWVKLDGRVFHVNEATCELMGYTYDELTSMEIFHFDAQFPREIWPDYVEKFRTEKHMVLESKHRAKDGRIFPVEIDANYCKFGDEEYCFAFVRDMTERQKAEEEIRKFKILADNANFGLVICNLKRDIIYTNNYFANLHGFTVDELIGKNAFMLHNDEQQNHIFHVTRQLKENNGFFATEIWHTRKDGSVFPMLMNGVLIYDDDNKPQFVGISAIDITEHKRLEEQLMQTQKMEAIGKLAGGIAHDFNNYLTGILGYSNLLLEKCARDEKMFDAAQTIVKAAQQASELTGQLLGFARKGKHQHIAVNLHDTLNDVIRLVFRTSHKNIQITQNFSSEPVYAMGDPVQIQQVFLNLVINAKDAMPNGGMLTVSIDRKTIDETYCRMHPDTREGTFAMVSVSDTGHGIPGDVREKIFEPFFTTKQKGEGSGMGLAVVYGIVKNHSGAICVETNKPRGTTFTVFLPLAADISVIESDESSSEPVHGSGYLLVVDDDSISAKTVSDMLDHLGYMVVTFTNSSDALTFYELHAHEINGLIVDMNMPRISGIECLKKLRKIRSDVKVILTTGYDHNGLVQELQHDRYTAFVQKPYRLVELSKIVAGILRK